MGKIIVYADVNLNVVSIGVAPEVNVEEAALKVVPVGTSYFVFNDSELPDQNFRNAWRLVDGVVVIDGALKEQLAARQVTSLSSITRRQCAKAMLMRGLISEQEALAMAQTGTPPAMVVASLESLSGPEKTLALIDFSANEYLRGNPLLNRLMLATGATEQDINQFFTEAAKL